MNKGEVKPLTSGERASISKFHIVVTKTMLVFSPLLLLLAQMLSNKLFAPAVREISFNRCLALSKESKSRHSFAFMLLRPRYLIAWALL